jgi:nickel transport protein
MAHGAHIDHEMTRAIAIRATYDSGEPMAEAQVVIYAPADPTTPWQTGMTDTNGRFVFVPDMTQSGNWDVQVRQAGHGNIVSIPVESEVLGATSAASASPESTEDHADNDNREMPPATQSSGSITPAQQGLMVLSVLWGCVGTALFFSRRKL